MIVRFSQIVQMYFFRRNKNILRYSSYEDPRAHPGLQAPSAPTALRRQSKFKFTRNVNKVTVLEMYIAGFCFELKVCVKHINML